MLAAAQASSAGTPRLDLRPLRGVEPVRAPVAERRERVAAPGPAEPAEQRRAPAAGYGRPAARGTADGPAAAGFLAQLLAQQDDGSEAPRLPHAEGVAAYRRAVGDDLLVVGPAGFNGLVL